MSSGLKKTLKIIVPIILGLFLVWYSLSKVSFSTLLSYFETADYTYIALAVFLGLLSHLSRAYRWLFILEPMGYKVKLSNSIFAVFIGYLVNYTIPRAGEIARVSHLTNYEGIPFEKGLGTVVAERVADLLVMLLIITITLFLQFEFIYDFFYEKLSVNKVISVIVVLILGVVIFRKVITKSKSRLVVKIKNFIIGLIEGGLSIFKMKKKWAYIFHTVFIWGMYILMFYVTSFAILGLQPIPFGAILVAFISASFSIAATNGGIGSYPIAVFAAFSLFGISEELSIAFGWIMWTAQTLLLIIGGGLSFLLSPLVNNVERESA